MCTGAGPEVEEVAAEASGQSQRGWAEAESVFAALRWDACDQFQQRAPVFRWAVGGWYWPVGEHCLGASGRRVGLEGRHQEEGRHVAVEDKDPGLRAAGEGEAARRLRTVAAEVHPAVAKPCAPEQMLATVPRRE